LSRIGEQDVERLYDGTEPLKRVKQLKRLHAFPWVKKFGAYGIRTRDLLNAIEALYQLS
jgi:hypothetical protein